MARNKLVCIAKRGKGWMSGEKYRKTRGTCPRPPSENCQSHRRGAGVAEGPKAPATRRRIGGLSVQNMAGKAFFSIPDAACRQFSAC